MAQRVPAIDKPVDGPHIAAEVGRLFVLLVVATLLQTTVAANIRILGANPDFVLVFVVAVALLRGAEIGAAFGFVAGGLVSIALFEPPGVRSLALVAVGYLVGRYAETADLSPSVAPIVSVFVGDPDRRVAGAARPVPVRARGARPVPDGPLGHPAARARLPAGRAALPRGALVAER